MRSMTPDASFELSKNNQTILQFFHHRGRHFLFKGVRMISLDMLDLIDEKRPLKNLTRKFFFQHI